MSEFPKIPLGELAVRVRCNQCRVVTEVSASRVGLTLAEGKCSCGRAMYTPEMADSTGHPFRDFQNAVVQLATLGTADVEFVRAAASKRTLPN